MFLRRGNNVYRAHTEAMIPMFLRRDNQVYKVHKQVATLKKGQSCLQRYKQLATLMHVLMKGQSSLQSTQRGSDPHALRRGNHVHKAHREVVGQSRLQSTQKEGLTPMGQEGKMSQCRDPVQCMFLRRDKKGQSCLQSTQRGSDPHVLKKGQSSVQSTQTGSDP